MSKISDLIAYFIFEIIIFMSGGCTLFIDLSKVHPQG